MKILKDIPVKKKIIIINRHKYKNLCPLYEQQEIWSVSGLQENSWANVMIGRVS